MIPVGLSFRNSFIPESTSSSRQVNRFSHRGERETRVTVDARDYGKEKNERPKFSRERASGCEAVTE